MVKLTIASNSRLLVELVASFLRQVCPGATITPDVGRIPATTKGAQVTAVSTGRWLHVSVESGLAEEAVRALSDGACAVLNLESCPDDFRLAVDALLGNRESHVPMDIVRAMAAMRVANKNGVTNGQDVKLTDRERDVLQLVAAGCSNAEVANRLTISIKTVRSHLHALAVKLDADNRVRMLANARALGLVEATAGVDHGKRTA